MKRKILIICFVGLVVRILLSFSTYHSDVVPFEFAGRVISEGNVLNFYDFLFDLPADHEYLTVYPRNLFNYPPVVYFFLGSMSLLTTWMVSLQTHNGLLFDLPSVLGTADLGLLLLLLKLPYFVFDVLCAFLLMKFFKKERNKLLVFTLWLFNPINLFATYMMGMFEIIPVFFVIWGLYFAVKSDRTTKSLVKAAVILGLGAAFKIYPLLFLPALAFLKKGWKERVSIVAAGAAVYVLTILPFLGSPGFRRTALVAGQTMKSLYARVAISGGEAIIFFPAILILFYFLFLFRKGTVEKLWERFFLVLLLFFTLTHFHPQWFLWITPFLIIDLIKSKLKHWPLVILVLLTFLGQLSFFDPGLSVWLFSPIFPNLYGMAGIWEQLGMNPDLNLSRSLLQTVMVGGFLYYFYLYFPRKTKKVA